RRFADFSLSFACCWTFCFAFCMLLYPLCFSPMCLPATITSPSLGDGISAAGQKLVKSIAYDE
ncbi:MAG: hypothetical protein LWW81_06885, partial [Rhodocyclales bacterium]|nr:hypothetical protein [Rhodocyclales bacterium]